MKAVTYVFLFFLFAGSFSDLYAQTPNTDKPAHIYFLQPAFSVGRNVRNFTTFPESGWRKCFTLDVGTQVTDTSKYLSFYYNFPQYGISFSIGKLGNDSLLGNEISITPFLTYNPSGNHFKGLNFRLGIGLSYFTEFYNIETNRDNKAIGSKFTWSFRGIVSKSIYYKGRTSINLSFGYSHASNGHTQLPNFGLNAAMFGLSCQFFTGQDGLFHERRPLPEINKTKAFFLYLRQGSGVNELGGTSGPVGGEKGMIYSASVAGGILFSQHIKVRAGFTYRYYQLISRYDSEMEPWEYSQPARIFASNVYFFAGCEFLIGHFGLDAEGGLNLYKPFYRNFFETFESGSEFSYWLRKLFPTRLGLNYYLVSSEKNPKNNLSIGAFINANFGEADFSELSIAYTRMID